MTHILVKGGRVITQGGRVLTSAGGAPCCCGGGQAIPVLPCFCADGDQLRYVPADNPQVVDDMLARRNLSDGLICYNFSGDKDDFVNLSSVDPSLVLDLSVFSTVVNSCFDPPCNTPPFCADDVTETPQFALECGTGFNLITFDPASRPADGVTMMYQDVRYEPIGVDSDQPPVNVVWSPDPCEGVTYKIAVECGGSQTITYDPDTRPQDGVTLLAGGVRYQPTDDDSDTPPTPAMWSPDSCPPPDPTNPCADLVPNDPRCNDPAYWDCPQCVGSDSGRPQPEPDFDLQTDPQDPGLGDAVARAIEIVTAGKLKPCSACDRRRQILNRFGERVGRRVIRALGL